VFASVDTRKWIRHAKISGVISMCQPEMYAAEARYVVGVGGRTPRSKSSAMPYVDVDPKALGEMAVKYFIDRGFSNFGMIDMGTAFHSRHRGEAFVAALQRRELSCSIYNPRKKYTDPGRPVPFIVDSDEQIRRWIMGLPKPLAVFAADDRAGLWTCVVCWSTGINVPEEVVVLGADDDEMFSGMAQPHLSSIRVPAEQVGFEAARILDTMIAKRRVTWRSVLLPPIGIVTRQSTDTIAVDDNRVADAVRYISDNAQRGIRVEDVAEHVSLPRRMLERRFKSAIGRGPFAEIRRVQIGNIKMLLAQTDKTIETVASECGFDNVMPMGEAFKKATGMPPGAWRRQFRNR
jgi:LacI family transcriptional regulator